ncbi:unnamed protein product [Cochlearia groenlandica]
MDEHVDVSRGVSSISRSGLKTGDDELDESQDISTIRCVNPILKSGNTGYASKDTEKDNVMSQVGKVSQSFGDEGKSHKTELVDQEVKPCPSKLGLNTNLDCEKRALVKRNDGECAAQKRIGLDLNADAVSSCLSDDLSSICSSKRQDTSSSRTVYSECGSNDEPVEEKDPMKLWKTMKQNGFVSMPYSRVSATSSSSIVSSSHGGIPAPRKRPRKIKNNDPPPVKKRKIEIAKTEKVVRSAGQPRPPSSSGLLNQLNPSIINHVRNKKQVLSIIENIVKSERESGNFYDPSMRHSNNIVEGSRKNSEDVNTNTSRATFNQGDKHAMPEDNYFRRYHDEKCSEGEFSEENNTIGSRFQVSGKISENGSSLSTEVTPDLNCPNVLTVKAATVASQWLELLEHDIKGRLFALRRSKKRVQAVETTELPFLIKKEFSADQENDPNLLPGQASRTITADSHKTRWMSLFNQLEQTLSEEEKHLENWLNQVRELQSHCDRGLQYLSLSSGQNFLQLGTPLGSRASDALMSDKGLVVRAAAASIYSTCNFLASKGNITSY